jgi:predicted dehydrogenase/aryl-alcohol dehydrogenase-like predicted oxidoreductase
MTGIVTNANYVQHVVGEWIVSGEVIRWGILGPGSIARRFAGQLPQSSTGRLQAVASRTLGRAEEFGAEFGATSYGSYEELLSDPHVDAIYIATVHINHHDLAIRAAAAGKHIICEKPLALNHAWAMASVEAARRQGVFLAEAYMYRFHPQTQLVRKLVEDGAIGDLYAIEASFAYHSTAAPQSRTFNPAMAGGGILDVGGYPVSMARMLAGAALGLPFIDPETLTATGQLGATGVDDWTVATLQFHTGVTARVATGVRAADDNTVKLYGSRGHLEVPDPWVITPTNPGAVIVTSTGRGTRTIPSEPGYSYALEADAVGERGDRLEAPQMSWNDSLGNARVLDRWRDAIELTYPIEADDASHPSLSRHTRPASDPAIPTGSIPGVAKPLSRLVMGCDNQTTMAHASVMFDDFLARGGTTFDTGYVYGRGRMESLLGRWVTNRGVRDQVAIIGKGAHTPFCDPESLTRQLHETLDRLGTDHLDLYLMHRDNPEISVSEFIDVLDQHQRSGLVHAFGGSNWSIDRFTEANRYARASGKHPLVALSNHFGLARAHDVPWAGCEHVTDPASRAWLTLHQVPLLPWSSQARGFFAPFRAHPDQRNDPELVRCYYSDENFERLRRANLFGERRGVQATAIALAYVLHQPFPTFALIGPRTLAETRTSTEALKIQLSAEELGWLDLSRDLEP